MSGSLRIVGAATPADATTTSNLVFGAQACGCATAAVRVDPLVTGDRAPPAARPAGPGAARRRVRCGLPPRRRAPPARGGEDPADGQPRRGGRGNIYANEALFRAGIRPTALHRLTRATARGRRAVRAVLTAAIAWAGRRCGISCARRSPGYFVSDLRVYGRGGETCAVCGAVLKATAGAAGDGLLPEVPAVERPPGRDGRRP